METEKMLETVDFSRFSKTEKALLEKLLQESRFLPRGADELGDEELDRVIAAGVPVVSKKKEK